MDAKFEELSVFAESDTMRDYIVDIRSHIDEIVFNTTMQLGLTEEEIDEICAANIPDETPPEIYSSDYKYKFGYLFWRLFHFRNWNPGDDKKEEEDKKSEDIVIDVPAEAPVKATKTRKSKVKSALKSVVVTGKLKNFTRKEIESFIKEHNFNLDPYVRKTTDYLICNDLNSKRGKLRDANHYGTTIISEDEFLKMAEQNV